MPQLMEAGHMIFLTAGADSNFKMHSGTAITDEKLQNFQRITSAIRYSSVRLSSIFSFDI